MPRPASTGVLALSLLLLTVTLPLAPLAGATSVSVELDRLHESLGALPYMDYSSGLLAVVSTTADTLYVLAVDGGVVWSRGFESPVAGVAWNGSGDLLAVHVRGRVELYNRNGERLWRAELDGEGYPSLVAFDGDNRVIALATLEPGGERAAFVVFPNGTVAGRVVLPPGFRGVGFLWPGPGTIAVHGYLEVLPHVWYEVLLVDTRALEIVRTIRLPPLAVAREGAVWALDEANQTLYRLGTDWNLTPITTLEPPGEGWGWLAAFDVSPSSGVVAMLYVNSTGRTIAVYSLESGSLESLVALPGDNIMAGHRLVLLPYGLALYTASAGNSRVAVVDWSSGEVLLDEWVSGDLYDYALIERPGEALVVFGSTQGLVTLRVTPVSTLRLSASDVPLNITVVGATGELIATLTLEPGESGELRLQPGEYTVRMRPESLPVEGAVVPPETLDYLESVYTLNISLGPGEARNITGPTLEDALSHAGLLTVAGEPGANITVRSERLALNLILSPESGKVTLVLPPGNYTISTLSGEEVEVALEPGREESVELPAGASGPGETPGPGGETSETPGETAPTRTPTPPESPAQQPLTTPRESGGPGRILLLAGAVLVIVALALAALVRTR